uniref:Protein FMC1 homolog n=1 Tax=Rhabditophanes sp. KR3021 TaxID=114890 RepID=A0AC35TXM3_9BILA
MSSKLISKELVQTFKTMFKEISKIQEKEMRDIKVYQKTLAEFRKSYDPNTLILKNINKHDALNNSYATYLVSTKRLSDLQDQYRGGERSIEDSAKIVGLAMPILCNDEAAKVEPKTQI